VKTVKDEPPSPNLVSREGLNLVIPSLLTSTRLLITCVLLARLGSGGWGLPLFSLACLTDALDGWAARRLHWETRAGSLLDASADFALVASTSAFLAWRRLAPAWFPALIVLCFARFILARPGPGRDPLGKHIGTVLFVALGLVLAIPAPFVSAWSTGVASCYMIVSMAVSSAMTMRKR